MHNNRGAEKVILRKAGAGSPDVRILMLVSAILAVLFVAFAAPPGRIDIGYVVIRPIFTPPSGNLTSADTIDHQHRDRRSDHPLQYGRKPSDHLKPRGPLPIYLRPQQLRAGDNHYTGHWSERGHFQFRAGDKGFQADRRRRMTFM